MTDPSLQAESLGGLIGLMMTRDALGQNTDDIEAELSRRRRTIEEKLAKDDERWKREQQAKRLIQLMRRTTR